MLILVTNDDGIHSYGLQALSKSLSALGKVVVVAPDRERSAVGHSLTLHSPLRADGFQMVGLLFLGHQLIVSILVYMV